MRRWLCVPMMILCLLATACGNTETATTPDDAREAYRTMAGCTMEAVVSCRQEDGLDWEARLRCDYVPDGTITVEVLEPESIAGIRATVSETDWTLEYEDLCLNAGTISAEEISPALCLPRLMNALREGWLLEENEETWQEIPCLRLSMDQSGTQGGKIVSTVWLSQEAGTPVRGEVAVDGETIFTAEFTSFAFCDTVEETLPEDG